MGLRPWWMTALLAFCAYMTVAYVPFDLFWKPVETDTEVWLGIPLHGWWAKATEPLHWAIYAAGTWGFWKMRSWMHPWAAVYTASVAVGMLVWGATDPRGGQALAAGALGAVLFGVLAVALWRTRIRFATRAGDGIPRP
jgi:hypothetical protein